MKNGGFPNNLYVMPFSGDIRREWRPLQSRSIADALFIGWEWQSSWWHVFAGKGSRSHLVWLRNMDGQAIGLLPCYSCRVTTKGVLPVTRLQLMGGAFRGSEVIDGAIRSEHLGLLVNSNSDVNYVAQEFLKRVMALEWQEFVLQDLDVDHEVNRLLVAGFARQELFVRVAERNSSYSISLPAKFEYYLANLSGNTRRRLYNKRAILDELGKIEIVDLSKDDWIGAVDVLSDLHALRWGKPVYSEVQLRFHTELRNRLGTDKVEVSCLMLNGRPISVLHNITVDGVVYNLQSGFDTAVDPRISPMLLHLGMAIEAAIDKGHQRFHLLAGTGKNADYKAAISTDQHNLVDIQIIRDRALATAYKIHDMLLRRKTRMKDFPSLKFPLVRVDNH